MEREDQLNMSRADGIQGESTLTRVKKTVAVQLSKAAQTLHQKSTQEVDNRELSNLGHRAADWLERSADYVRDVEPQRLKSDLENQVRRNPGKSLLIAGIAGLVIGRILRRG
ncbi:MAG TPA: hypothetical protein VJ302_24950 [Blastocatellia bacterium]|nr:hypothetical protein [Blastocatellia bacterium]